MSQKMHKVNLEERVKSLELENRRLRSRLEQFDLNSTDNNKRTLASRGLLQIVLDSIPVRIFWKDLDSKYLGCNKLFAFDAGLEAPEEIIGKSDVELSWSNKAHIYREDDKWVMSNDRPKLNYQELQIQPDGAEHVIRKSKVPLKDKHGTIFGVLGSYEDITDHDKAQKALQENVHFQKVLLNSMPNPVFYKDEKGRYTGCNQAFEEFLGCKKEDIIGKSVYDLSPQELAHKYFQMDKELFDNPGVQIYESSVADKSGKRHDVVFNKATFEKSDGTLGGLVGVIVDITERKEAEEAIQALIESTVGKSGNDFFEKTVVKLCEWLQADCALIGEIIDESISTRSLVMDGNILPPCSYELKGSPCEITVKEGFCHFPTSVAKLYPSNKFLTDMGVESYAGVLFHDEKGKPLGLLCLFSRNIITLPPKAKDVLEIIAAKISVEIAHARTFGKLHAAKEDAEKANNAKSDFLSSMSHELRTPLTAILGFAHLLQEDLDGSFTDIQKESIEEIVTSGYHLYKIITELLDLSTIESGATRMSIVSLPVKTVLLDAIRLISPLTKKKEISIHDKTDLRDDLMIKADKFRIKQVLINLLSNAVKYNSQQGTIVVSAQEIEKKALRISITDTGYGISEEQQDQIFEPFHRNDAYMRGIDGTGIGLSVSKRYMELMGGSIGVTSEPDKGSTFWIEIDLCSEKG